MASYKFSEGDTNGAIHFTLCETCQINQRHTVVVSARKRYDGEDYAEIEEFEVVRCLNCDTFSFRKESSNSEGYHYNPETGDYDSEVDVSLYPSRVAGRFKIKGHAQLPTEVRAAYDEMMLALNGDQPILGGLGVRLLIEMICRERAASGKTLFDKIDDLKSKGVLTHTGADILHKLRSMGNNSAHEAKPSTAKQMMLAVDVVENLLQSVYIHPEQAKSAFK